MRYATPIYFQHYGKPEYNPATGDYEQSPPVEHKRYASVTDSGIEVMKLVYGDIKQGSKVIRIQRPYTGAYDSIRIGDECYHVDMSRKGKVYIVSEVQ